MVMGAFGEPIALRIAAAPAAERLAPAVLRLRLSPPMRHDAAAMTTMKKKNSDPAEGKQFHSMLSLNFVTGVF